MVPLQFAYIKLFFYFFRYERFVVALEEASKDMLPVLKDKALKVSLNFLVYQPFFFFFFQTVFIHYNSIFAWGH